MRIETGAPLSCIIYWKYRAPLATNTLSTVNSPSWSIHHDVSKLLLLKLADKAVDIDGPKRTLWYCEVLDTDDSNNYPGLSPIYTYNL